MSTGDDRVASGDAVQLEFSEDELLMVNNALNEVCNGIDIDDLEFSARIGADREKARALLGRVRALYDEFSRR